MRTADRFYLMVGVALGAGVAIGLLIDIFGQQSPAGTLAFALTAIWCLIAILIGYWPANKFRTPRVVTLVGLLTIFALAVIALIIF